ncbi:MAG: hypothetical protein R6V52_07240 [Bacteroidales bacterium]
MGCLKLIYYQPEPQLKVVHRKTEPQQKLVQSWLNVDPMSDLHPDYTPYAYVYNNPMNYIDPFGLDTVSSNANQEQWRNFDYEEDVMLHDEDIVIWETSTQTDYDNRIIEGGGVEGHVSVLATLYDVFIRQSLQYGLESGGMDEDPAYWTSTGVTFVGSIILARRFSSAPKGAARGITRSLDDLSTIKGATWKEAKRLIPKEWKKVPMRKGKGIKYVNPNKKGEQILLEKGWPGAKDPLHAGPYMKVSQKGKITRIPLAGNPTLK